MLLQRQFDMYPVDFFSDSKQVSNIQLNVKHVSASRLKRLIKKFRVLKYNSFQVSLVKTTPNYPTLSQYPK